jgi:G3E family GTPase
MAQGALTMIDVWILGGYLGSGKTTALNELLTHGSLAYANPALIINEFGKIGVDGSLVQRQELRRFEINKGSLFCICTKTDFLKALSEIARQDSHRAVLIEATGIAEPVDIEHFLTEGPHAGNFRMRGNLCIVDAVNFIKIAPYLKPAVSQVRWADALVINKCDLADKDQLEILRRILKSMNSDVPVIETSFGRIEGSFLETVIHRSRKENLVPCAPEKIYAVSFGVTQRVCETKFNDVLRRYETSILRLKGNIVFDTGPAFMEIICGKLSKKEMVELLWVSTTTPTAFTVIAWNTDKPVLQQAFEECWITTPKNPA